MNKGRWSAKNSRPFKSSKDFGVWGGIGRNWRTPKAQKIEVSPGRVVEFVYDPVSRLHSALRFCNESRLALIDMILDDWMARETVEEVLGGEWQPTEIAA